MTSDTINGQLYGRRLQLTVAGSSASTPLDLSALRIQFRVVGPALAPQPKTATITIWNPNQQTVNAVIKEFTQVTLQAGYQNARYGQIFNGTICRVASGKENAMDSYLRLFAQEGDEGLNWSLTNTTLAAGWTDDMVYQQLMSDFGKHGITEGYKPTFTTARGPRGLPLYGLTRDKMNELASNQGCDWFIDDGKVYLLPKGQSLPGNLQTLSSATGLIGVPELTLGGINVRSLLDPNLKQGYAVRIDNKSIADLIQKQPLAGGAVPVPALQADGLYVAHYVVHAGDTRGNEWYTDFVGISKDVTGPSSQSPQFTDTPETV